MSMSMYASSADYWKAQAEKYAKDAARYRWLRDNQESDLAICEWCADHCEGTGYYRDARASTIVDAAVDAAMLASPAVEAKAEFLDRKAEADRVWTHQDAGCW